MLEQHANDLINKGLRSIMWPHVEKKYNKMLGLGIKLPSPCGMTFLDPTIVNEDQQIKICSNLKFDSAALIDRIGQWEREKIKKPSA